MGVSGAAATVLLQAIVGAMLPPSRQHLGGEIFVMTLLALPVLGFLFGVLVPLQRNRSVLVRSFLASPGLYYCGWMIGTNLTRSGTAMSLADLQLLGRALLMVFVAAGVATLIGVWLGRLRLPSEKGSLWVCAKCGYKLTGNASGRCPECGIPVTVWESEPRP